MIELNELRDRAYKNAVAHGWHEENKSDRHWLCLVISELMEAVEADRKGRHANVKRYKDMTENSLICKGYNTMIPKEKGFIVAYEETIKDSVEDELADACIRLFDLAGLRDLQLTYTNGFAIMKMSFTEYIYCLCSFITSPGKSSVGWLDRHISYSLGWIFSWCRAKNIDIEWHIEQKMKYNELRPYKHGNKKY